jgi:hypothetical protein
VTTVGQEAIQSFGELSGKKSSQPIDGSSKTRAQTEDSLRLVAGVEGGAWEQSTVGDDLSTERPARSINPSLLFAPVERRTHEERPGLHPGLSDHGVVSLVTEP